MKTTAGIIFLALAAAVVGLAAADTCNDDFCACVVEVVSGADGTVTETCPDDWSDKYDETLSYDCYPDEDGGGAGIIVCAGYNIGFFEAGAPTVTKGCTISNGEGKYSWIISDGAYNVGPTIANYNSFSSPAPLCAEVMGTDGFKAAEVEKATARSAGATSMKAGAVWIMSMTTLLPLMTPLLRY